LHWPLLALMLATGLAFFVIRAGRGARGADGHERRVGLTEYLLPRKIYTHPSARVDIGLYVLDRALMAIFVTTTSRSVTRVGSNAGCKARECITSITATCRSTEIRTWAS
jgi:hypothetical protein